MRSVTSGEHSTPRAASGTHTAESGTGGSAMGRPSGSFAQRATTTSFGGRGLQAAVREARSHVSRTSETGPTTALR
jgi:hypothetical protein